MVEISFVQLLIGLLLVLVPAVILYYYQTGLVRALLVSVVRMVLQLFLVGVYLKYLFEWNNTWVNIAWLLIMTFVCAFTLLKRVDLPVWRLFIPIYLSILFALVIIAVYFLKGVLQIEYLFESRYFIPICGILLGNILSTNVVGLNALYDGLFNGSQYYHYLLCNGAKIEEALKPFFQKALIKASNPTIASMAVMGLISLPGTLIGQILGGSPPGVAIRYQIMIMVIIASSSLISLFLCMRWSVKSVLNEYGCVKADFNKRIK
ncbi:ABC transporter permease [Porphyromonadaceae bacterium W3.11]|nr:ABC transporter permease [Porphyromonadaceae bacterium W3.11]